MSRVVVARRPAEPVAKQDVDAVESFAKQQLDDLLAQAENDPEIQELVRKCMADPGSPSQTATTRRIEPVAIRKSEPAAPPPTLAELEARLASANANIAAYDAQAALAKGDLATAQAIFTNDPTAYEAYEAHIRGQRYQAPAPIAKAEPDHRGTIRKMVQTGDYDGLGQLLRTQPGADRQYHEMLPELAAIPLVRRAVAKGADIKSQLLAALQAKDHDELERLKRTAAGQVAWRELVASGRIKVAL